MFFARHYLLPILALFALALITAFLSTMNAQSSGGTLPFQLPFDGGGRSDKAVFRVKNMSPARTASGLEGDGAYIGVFGVTTEGGIGVAGLGSSEDGSAQRSLGKGIGVYGGSTEVGVKGVNGRQEAPNTYGTLGNKDAGVTGVGTTDQVGVMALANKGTAVYGRSTEGSGVEGYHGPQQNPQAFGALGYKDEGVHGWSKTFGVRGLSEGVGGIGVQGENEHNSYGVLGEKDAGVKGIAEAPDANAVFGSNKAGPFGFIGGKEIGVKGESRVARGVGVGGVAEGGADSVGVMGVSKSGIAGFFRGKVTITESLLINEINVKKLFGAAKLFRIDHPVEPATKYLSHASVESNEMTNFYSGNVVLDSDGAAWVELSHWFEALNGNFRYQLTCIGQFASVYIAQEIEHGRFRIAGGKPGLKVSWQVAAIRKDAYAKAHPLHVEEEKAPQDRGRYLNPVELGLAASQGIGYGQVSPLGEEPLQLVHANHPRNLSHYDRK
jgi:hypothetical protein